MSVFDKVHSPVIRIHGTTVQ